MTVLPGTVAAAPPHLAQFATSIFHRARAAARTFTSDARHYQMSVQALLLLYGLFALSFEMSPGRAALIFAGTLGTQAIGARLTGTRFEWRSALISGLGLCLLMRTATPWLAIVTAVLTIAGKFVLRVRGKHIWNPTVFGLGVMMLLVPGGVWLSAGQWGHVAFLGFAICCLGSIVVTRAAAADVTFGFLAAWALVLFGRAAWLGQPWTTPLHQLTNGSLLLYAFFMISDPRTTPDSRLGRVLFVTLVALGAGVVQFVLWRTNGPVWALFACAPLVPVIDRWLPGARHHWRKDAPSTDSQEGDTDETAPLPTHPSARPAVGGARA